MTGFLDRETVEAIRARLRNGIASNTAVPPDLIDEVVDLAVHAAVSSFESCMAIAGRTSPDPRIGMTATGPALSLLIFLATQAVESLKEAARAEGMAHGEFNIGGRA